MTSETGAQGTVGYEYDAAGNMTRVAWPDGYYAEYAFNAASEMTSVKENGSVLLASYGYDAIGRRASITRGNGVTTSYGYDAASRLTSLGHDLLNAANDDARSFAYNPASQIVDRGPRRFQRKRRRLMICANSARKRGTCAGAAYVYAVPAALNQSAVFNGPRPSRRDGRINDWRGASAQNRSHFCARRAGQPTTIGGATISHDNRGNLTSDGATTYAYDVDNRLVSASNGTSLAWDAIGRLRQTQQGATTTRLLYAGEELIAEYDGGGTTCGATIRLNDQAAS